MNVKPSTPKTLASVLASNPNPGPESYTSNLYLYLRHPKPGTLRAKPLNMHVPSPSGSYFPLNLPIYPVVKKYALDPPLPAGLGYMSRGQPIPLYPSPTNSPTLPLFQRQRILSIEPKPRPGTLTVQRLYLLSTLKCLTPPESKEVYHHLKDFFLQPYSTPNVLPHPPLLHTSAPPQPLSNA